MLWPHGGWEQPGRRGCRWLGTGAPPRINLLPPLRPWPGHLALSLGSWPRLRRVHVAGAPQERRDDGIPSGSQASPPGWRATHTPRPAASPPPAPSQRPVPEGIPQPGAPAFRGPEETSPLLGLQPPPPPQRGSEPRRCRESRCPNGSFQTRHKPPSPAVRPTDPGQDGYVPGVGSISALSSPWAALPRATKPRPCPTSAAAASGPSAPSAPGLGAEKGAGKSPERLASAHAGPACTSPGATGAVSAVYTQAPGPRLGNPPPGI